MWIFLVMLLFILLVTCIYVPPSSLLKRVLVQPELFKAVCGTHYHGIVLHLHTGVKSLRNKKKCRVFFFFFWFDRQSLSSDEKPIKRSLDSLNSVDLLIHVGSIIFPRLIWLANIHKTILKDYLQGQLKFKSYIL